MKEIRLLKGKNERKVFGIVERVERISFEGSLGSEMNRERPVPFLFVGCLFFSLSPRDLRDCFMNLQI